MTLTSIITWGLTLLGLAVGATFAITKYISSNTIKLLENRLKYKEDKIQEYEQRLSNIQPSLSFFPARKVAAELENADIENLVSKIEDLEKQRENLLAEVSSKASSSLDPRSELSNLLEQLKSDDADVRSKAINGLFTIRDPLSFLPMIKYLDQRPDEATQGRNPHIRDWFSFFIATGSTSGVEFVAAQLENPLSTWGDNAFSALKYDLDTVPLIEDATSVLENIALRSSSSLARTKAKVLLKILKTKKQEIDERGQFIKRTEFDIPHNFIIMTVLNRNGLEHLTADMVAHGHVFEYWRTGIIIAQEFLNAPTNRDNCVSAMRDLLSTKARIASTSQCMLLFVLAKMEQFRGNNIAADEYLESCKNKNAQTFEYLINNSEAYNLNKLQGFLTKAKKNEM